MSNTNINASTSTNAKIAESKTSIPESPKEETRFCHCCDREYPVSALTIVEGGEYSAPN